MSNDAPQARPNDAPPEIQQNVAAGNALRQGLDQTSNGSWQLAQRKEDTSSSSLPKMSISGDGHEGAGKLGNDGAGKQGSDGSGKQCHDGSGKQGHETNHDASTSTKQGNESTTKDDALGSKQNSETSANHDVTTSTKKDRESSPKIDASTGAKQDSESKAKLDLIRDHEKNSLKEDVNKARNDRFHRVMSPEAEHGPLASNTNDKSTSPPDRNRGELASANADKPAAPGGAEDTAKPSDSRSDKANATTGNRDSGDQQGKPQATTKRDVTSALSEIKTPDGMTLTKDLKDGSWDSNAGEVGSVKEHNGNIQINWDNKDGSKAVTNINKFGTETSYDPPVKSGNISIQSEERRQLPNGNLEKSFHTPEGRTVRGEFNSKNELQGKLENIPAPKDLKTPQDLDKAAGEVARIIDKNGGKFGGENDQKYIGEVNAAFQKQGKQLSESLSNKLADRKSPYDIDDTSLRPSINGDPEAANPPTSINLFKKGVVGPTDSIFIKNKR